MQTQTKQPETSPPPLTLHSAVATTPRRPPERRTLPVQPAVCRRKNSSKTFKKNLAPDHGNGRQIAVRQRPARSRAPERRLGCAAASRLCARVLCCLLPRQGAHPAAPFCLLGPVPDPNLFPPHAPQQQPAAAAPPPTRPASVRPRATRACSVSEM